MRENSSKVKMSIEATRKKHLITQTSEACSNMIVGVRQLRLSVLDLFTTLADNGPDPNRNQQAHQDNIFIGSSKLYHQQTLSNIATSHTLCTSSNPPLRIQKQQEEKQQAELVQCVSQMISTMTQIIRGLDQDINILSQNSAMISPGESVNLGMDFSLDKHNLYVDLCKSYKTYAKLHDYSTHCHALLHQQSLKRVHRNFERSVGGAIGGATGVAGSAGGGGIAGGSLSRNTKSESIVATFNPYIYKVCSSRNEIVRILESCMKICEFINGTYSQPFGISTGLFQISVNRVLKAILVMRGIVIDAVIVKAYHESFAAKTTSRGGTIGLMVEAGASPFVDPDDDIDLWSESKYAVFRKLTHHANAAVLHFQYPTYPEIAVRSFLSWFNSYSDLFAATCSRCNSRLRKFMPPICRDFSSGFLPHHDSCK